MSDLAANRRRPSETQPQAFNKFVADGLGYQLLQIQKVMSGPDVMPSKPTAPVCKNLDDPELTWNALVAGIAKLMNCSLSFPECLLETDTLPLASNND